MRRDEADDFPNDVLGVSADQIRAANVKTKYYFIRSFASV